VTTREPPLSAVILAAGAGARLGALGQRHSKAMVPIARRPLIDWVIARLRAARVERLIAVGHGGDAALASWLRDRHPEVTLAVQPERRGIADAVGCALPLLGDVDGYLACACDSLFTPPDIAAVIAAGRARPAVAVVGILDMGPAATSSRSAVALDGARVTAIVEKPAAGHVLSGVVAAPLYWLTRAFDALLPATRIRDGERHVSSALQDFIDGGGTVLAVPLSGRIEITTAEDVARAEAALG
jgi:glucose-1-phosphate thymidylyltransferase